MSNVFGDELLGMILPIVEQRFRESDWRLRESAILAVGAVSEGCDAGLTPFLPQLIEFLVPSLEDPRPMLRATACWTLSRFARYTAQLAFAARPGDPPPATAAQGRAFVERILGGLLRRVGDKNKHVQAAACGALATLLGECREDIAPWLSPTASTLGQAIASYGRKNLRCALDAAATLADSGGDALKDPAVARALLGPLLQKWESGGDNQADLYQLLECVTSVTMGVGLGAQEFAAPMFSRALALARRALVARDAQDSAYEPDHVVCALEREEGYVVQLQAVPWKRAKEMTVGEQRMALRNHPEKKAFADLLDSGAPSLEIKINFNICVDCHEFFKAASRHFSRRVQVVEQKMRQPTGAKDAPSRRPSHTHPTPAGRLYVPAERMLYINRFEKVYDFSLHKRNIPGKI